jgi:hypothetical protein
MYEGKYRGQWLSQKQQSAIATMGLPRRPPSLDDLDHVNGHVTAHVPRWLLLSFALAH